MLRRVVKAIIKTESRREDLISKFQIINLINIYIGKRRHFQMPNMALVFSLDVLRGVQSAFEQ
jgi:hypothetical protein